MNTPKVSDTHQKFKEIVHSKYKKFYTHACIQTGCKDTAKDLVQEAFITAFEKLDSFKHQSSLETWIFGILNNKIQMHYRDKEKRKHTTAVEPEKILFHKNGSWKKEWMQHEPSHIEKKEHEQEKNKLIQFLNDCLNALKNQHRQILLMRFYLNKKTADICKLCAVSEDNVWQILHRSKLQLKICIQSKQKQACD